MRKVVQVDIGDGWNVLTTVFFERGQDEAKAKKEAERQLAGWSRNYEPYRDAQFRIITIR